MLHKDEENNAEGLKVNVNIRWLHFLWCHQNPTQPNSKQTKFLKSSRRKPIITNPINILTCNRQRELLSWVSVSWVLPLSNSFNVSCVSESHFFVYCDYATWHMPCCEPNVPMGGINSWTRTQLQFWRKQNCAVITVHYTWLSAVAWSFCRLVSSVQIPGPAWAGESKWVMLVDDSQTALKQRP